MDPELDEMLFSVERLPLRNGKGADNIADGEIFIPDFRCYENINKLIHPISITGNYHTGTQK